MCKGVARDRRGGRRGAGVDSVVALGPHALRGHVEGHLPQLQVSAHAAGRVPGARGAHVHHHAPQDHLQRRVRDHGRRGRHHCALEDPGQGGPRGQTRQGDELCRGDTDHQERPRGQESDHERAAQPGQRAQDRERVSAASQGDEQLGQDEGAHREVHTGDGVAQDQESGAQVGEGEVGREARVAARHRHREAEQGAARAREHQQPEAHARVREVPGLAEQDAEDPGGLRAPNKRDGPEQGEGHQRDAGPLRGRRAQAQLADREAARDQPAADQGVRGDEAPDRGGRRHRDRRHQDQVREATQGAGRDQPDDSVGGEQHPQEDQQDGVGRERLQAQDRAAQSRLAEGEQRDRQLEEGHRGPQEGDTGARRDHTGQGEAHLRPQEEEPGAREVQVRARLQDQGAEEDDRAARDGDQGPQGGEDQDGERTRALQQAQRSARAHQQGEGRQAGRDAPRAARRAHQAPQCRDGAQADQDRHTQLCRTHSGSQDAQGPDTHGLHQACA